MLELPLIKAEDTTEDVMATAQTVLHITAIAMVVGTMATIMCMVVSLVVTEAVAVWINNLILAYFLILPIPGLSD